MSGRNAETLAQAQRWEGVKKFALAAGLCDVCAPQLAWGSACGFRDVHPPCEACRPLVSAWPVEKQSSWRVPAGRLSDRSSWPHSANDACQAASGISGASSTVARASSAHTVAHGEARTVAGR